MIRQILWDWNGTLLDDLQYGIDVRNLVFPTFSLPTIDSVEEYHRQFTFPVRLYYERAGVTEEHFAEVGQAWMAEYVRGFDKVRLHADALSVLEQAQSRGLRQVILSASKLDLLKDQLAHFPIGHFFDTVLGLDNIYAGSKEDIGRQYIRTCGIAPRDTVMIGDTLHDADVAKALGCSCLLVSRGHQNRQTLLTAGVPVLSSLMEAMEQI